MAARAATFVIRRADIATLADAAREGAAGFKQALAQCMIGQGDGWGYKGYILAFVLDYLQTGGIWLGSEYQEAEQALASVAAVGGYLMTAQAFSSVDDLDPQRHDGADIERSITRLGTTVPDAAVDGVTWLGILHEKITALGDDQALLVLIG